MSLHLAQLLLLVTLLVCVAAAGPPPSAVLSQVVVVHRHGARSPLVSVNESGVCPKYGCGVLNQAGKDMLFHLGLFLREAYNNTLQPYDYYDYKAFVSRSTDVPRTLQSATSMVMGLFYHLANTSNKAEAVISTKPLSQATELLVWTGWPSIVIWQAVNTQGFFDYLDNKIYSLFSNSTLNAIGEAQGLALECTPGLAGFSPFQCALDAQDVMNCARSSGDDIPAIVQANSASLDQALEWYNSYSMWGYDDAVNDGKFVAQMGSYGYLLAKDIISKVRSQQTVLEHYSGHDTTLMPLWMTLGNYSLVNPAFGAAMIFETWTVNGSSTKGSNATLFIVAKLGNPGQLPGDHSYTVEPYSLNCINVKGQMYASTSGCLLDDFERYIDTRGPVTSEGICYVPQDWLPIFDCLPNSTTFATNPVCITYRQSCLVACGPQGSMMANYSCVL
jgi:hypothetical protein